jgi:hypothetical protein
VCLLLSSSASTMRRGGALAAAALNCVRAQNRTVARRCYASSSTERLARVTFKPCKETKSLVLDSPALGLKEATFPYVWLRDACQAPHSVHPGTKQKLFQTSDIDPDIEPVSIDYNEELESFRIVWDRGLRRPQNGQAQTRPLAESESVLPLELLRRYRSWQSWRACNWEHEMVPVTWDRRQLGMSAVSFQTACSLANYHVFASSL